MKTLLIILTIIFLSFQIEDKKIILNLGTLIGFALGYYYNKLK